MLTPKNVTKEVAAKIREQTSYSPVTDGCANVWLSIPEPDDVDLVVRHIREIAEATVPEGYRYHVGKIGDTMYVDGENVRTVKVAIEE